VRRRLGASVLDVAQNRRVDARPLRQLSETHPGVHAQARELASTLDPDKDLLGDLPGSVAEIADDRLAGTTVLNPALAVTGGA
jgi:hypothetical protein